MVLKIPDGGLLLESSAKSMAALPAQAFAISLSDSVIEDMIACVQNGQDIHLSLGSSPSFLFGQQEIRISDSPDFVDCDLFHTNSVKPASASKLQNPTMSIFKGPRRRPKALPGIQADEAFAKAPKPGTNKSGAHAERDTGDEGQDDAIAKLKNATAKAELDKRENSARLIEAVPLKGGKFKPSARVRLLGSHPSSPALNGMTSPSLESSSSNTEQAAEKSKKDRVPIVHELALRERSFGDIREKCTGQSDSEFQAALKKSADFDDKLQKYVLKKNCWKELDVYKYNYATEEDRQKVIENAIRQYDRMRITSTDDVWDRLLPESDRGKGICLSKLSAKIAKGPPPPTPKINVQKPEGSSASGESEKDDSTSTAGKKGKGGEPMTKPASQTKKKAAGGAEAPIKRILAGNTKKPALAKASPKASPTKTAAKTGGAAKGGKVKSKEFVTESDTDDDEETPLATSLPRVKAAAASKAAERPTEKSRVSVEKSAAPSAPKPRPNPATQPREKEPVKENKNETIEALLPKQAKRAREDEGDSSSSGTPLSKRLKKPKDTQKPIAHQSMAQAKQAAAAAAREQKSRPQPLSAAAKQHHRTVSDASSSQSIRASNNGGTMAPVSKNKNTSPAKSSPLASSPPTNASDIETERLLAREKEREREREKAREREKTREKEKAREKSREQARAREREQREQRERERARELERDRETVVSSSSSVNDGDSSSAGGGGGSGGGGGGDKKRSADEQSGGENRGKRQRLSAEVLNKAHKFKLFYIRYEQLHKDLAPLDHPPDDKMADLMEMHERLSKMKDEIYKEVNSPSNDD